MLMIEKNEVRKKLYLLNELSLKCNFNVYLLFVKFPYSAKTEPK